MDISGEGQEMQERARGAKLNFSLEFIYHFFAIKFPRERQVTMQSDEHKNNSLHFGH